jgi:hypothetical protein
VAKHFRVPVSPSTVRSFSAWTDRSPSGSLERRRARRF